MVWECDCWVFYCGGVVCFNWLFGRVWVGSWRVFGCRVCFLLVVLCLWMDDSGFGWSVYSGDWFSFVLSWIVWFWLGCELELWCSLVLFVEFCIWIVFYFGFIGGLFCVGGWRLCWVFVCGGVCVCWLLDVCVLCFLVVWFWGMCLCIWSCLCMGLWCVLLLLGCWVCRILFLVLKVGGVEFVCWLGFVCGLVCGVVF